MTTWLTDANGNRASVGYFRSNEKAKAALDSLKNCQNCTNCSGCSGCSGCSTGALADGALSPGRT